MCDGGTFSSRRISVLTDGKSFVLTLCKDSAVGRIPGTPINILKCLAFASGEMSRHSFGRAYFFTGKLAGSGGFKLPLSIYHVLV